MGITNQISQAMLDLAIARTDCKTGYRNPPPLTYTKKFPYWTAWPLTQNWEPVDSARVGPTPSHPHLWIVHYIIHTDSTISMDTAAADDRMHDDIDDLQLAWGSAIASKFGGLVESVGDMREWKYHPDGPFLQFAGRMVLGSYGVVSVVAPSIPFGCDIP